MSKPLSRIKTNPLQRRMSLSLAGLRSGSSIAMGGLGNLLKGGGERQLANEKLIAREARRFVAALGKLKGGYVKIGQMLGIYGENVLPKAVTRELQALNDQTAKLSWHSIDRQLGLLLQDRRNDFEVDHEPIAAASLGQVHRALHIPSGHQVCLKIQYPGVAEAIDNDFRDVIRILEISRWLKLNKKNKSLVQDVYNLLKEETNYLREAEMSQHFRTLLADDKRYRVPRVHREYCSEQLLVMDFASGHKLNSDTVSNLTLKRRNKLAEAILELFFKELFEWRLMQTDPNFGNYLVAVSHRKTELILLDFGAVRELERNLTDALCHTIASATERDLKETVSGLERLGFVHKAQGQQSREQFARFCYLLVEPFSFPQPDTPETAFNARGEYRWGNSNLVKRAAKLATTLAMSKDFSPPPPEFALITRKLSGVFSALAVLNAEFNPRPLIERYIEQWRSKQ